jgi:hypothetical protein
MRTQHNTLRPKVTAHTLARHIQRTLWTLFTLNVLLVGCGDVAINNGSDRPVPSDTARVDGGSVDVPRREFDAQGTDRDVTQPQDNDVPTARADVSTGNDSGGGAMRRDPPPFPRYSGAACPMLVSGATQATSRNENFQTGTQRRAFHLIVPPSYARSNEPWPLMFGFHWLNASAGSLIRDGEFETAAEQKHIIIVVPEALEVNGTKAYRLTWPFAYLEDAGAPAEMVFMQDMLACISAQYRVDPRRVYSMGVSAGALWTTYISSQPIADHFAAVMTLSGGLGSLPGTPWSMSFTPRPNKFPALVLWGGPSDNFIINFSAASMRYRDALIADNHFVVVCTHNAGHAVPPLPMVPGVSRFNPLWQFFLDHPYGTPPRTSPYQATGLPRDMPAWCSIATP